MSVSAPTVDPKARWLPEGTTAIGIGWVALTVYQFACFTASSGLRIMELVVTLITLMIAWAVMERKRWGRLSLLGIAFFTLVDYTYAAVRLASAPLSPALPYLHSKPFVMMLLYAKGSGMIVGGMLPSLCFMTLGWLAWKPVRAEFEQRKPTTTRRCQVGIALVLAGIYGLGIVQSGASHGVMGWLNAQRVQKMRLMQSEYPVGMRLAIKSIASTGR